MNSISWLPPARFSWNGLSFVINKMLGKQFKSKQQTFGIISGENWLSQTKCLTHHHPEVWVKPCKAAAIMARIEKEG